MAGQKHGAYFFWHMQVEFCCFIMALRSVDTKVLLLSTPKSPTTLLHICWPLAISFWLGFHLLFHMNQLNWPHNFNHHSSYIFFAASYLFVIFSATGGHFSTQPICMWTSSTLVSAEKYREVFTCETTRVQSGLRKRQQAHLVLLSSFFSEKLHVLLIVLFII